jgi:hypothetical protein
MALFSNKQEANLRSCIRMIEDALQSLGHPPDESRTESADDMPAWRVQTGAGSRVEVHLGVEDEKNVLRVTATVASVAAGPHGSDEAALYRKLLELNVSEVKGVAFGLLGREVVLIAERTTIDLDPSEVEDILRRTEGFAEHYAKLLAKDLGVTNRA